ncbi:glycine cleavage system aminomethyltransferase GcvT [Oecophyllibacter saccharovorans]|uniref:aminomethyltransferase n=1 Tax=Oecophyllibacter saccharovorans TaxID=2558360 RepID=A0A506ULG6_9PROT|nr:glycine cleavage system aminomethyltransferase GcvT [Oecophyllibacter saccharovorans]TPW34013.1 glycine cleavage system aminomethyltransferase GcvT [Oecophyllibacter saccharovorans]
MSGTLQSGSETSGPPLLKTPLHDLHVSLGARMVPFAGYAMPVQYTGVLEEHRHTRAKAGLFDVSHMGQIRLCPRAGHTPQEVALAFESLVPVNVADLAEQRQRYAFLTDEAGGILDDLMIARTGDGLLIVANAGCKEADAERIEQAAGDVFEVERQFDRALLALQGPAAETVLAELFPSVTDMKFMDFREVTWKGAPVTISRSGYTGEDGFEIGLPAERAEELARQLLAHPEVAPIGLGARDSLRLEAGLCLYGHDIEPTTSPVEAGLQWAIQKTRRPGGARAGGYPGAEVIGRQLVEGVARRRVGLRPQGRAPVREGVELFADEQGKRKIGRVTSGTFAPSLNAPVAMGYVETGCEAPGTRIYAGLRGRYVPVEVCALPFVPARFKR